MSKAANIVKRLDESNKDYKVSQWYKITNKQSGVYKNGIRFFVFTSVRGSGRMKYGSVNIVNSYGDFESGYEFGFDELADTDASPVSEDTAMNS
jgi:hypothetical protein